MNRNTHPTVIPQSYPALEAERYRAVESANERQTEPPPAPPSVIWDIEPSRIGTLVALPWGAR
jgi:hypothetical protein